MREFIFIMAILFIVIMLMRMVAKLFIFFDIEFLLPFLFSAPFALAAFINFKDARKTEKLRAGQKSAYTLRGFGFLVAIIPLFLHRTLDYYYLYSVGIVLASIIVAGILEHNAEK